MEQTIHLEGHVPGELARRDPYLYLPFPVPQGARRIHVAYSYSEPVTAPFGMGPGNTLDIGIFDSRGRDFLTAPGFRGWSGGARSEFYITPDEATPGYIKGALFPGEWNVMLGLARLEPEGVRYSVDVTVEAGETPALAHPEALEGRAAEPRPAIATAPVAAAGEGVWLKGDLHCHTVHSDGLNTVRELVENAVALGLDFLAITDHNTNTHHADLNAITGLPIVLIPGEEVTTYWGHANTWGLREWMSTAATPKRRCAASWTTCARAGRCSRSTTLSASGRRGSSAAGTASRRWRSGRLPGASTTTNRSRSGTANSSAANASSPSAARTCTRSRRPSPATRTASPSRRPGSTPATSEGGVLSAIAAGRVCVTDSPRSPVRLALAADADGDGRYEALMGDSVPPERVRFRAEVTAGREKRLWIVSDAGTLDIVPITEDDARVEFTADMSRHRYIRAELRGLRGRPERGEVVWALTNPIYRAER